MRMLLRDRERHDAGATSVCRTARRLTSTRRKSSGRGTQRRSTIRALQQNPGGEDMTEDSGNCMHHSEFTPDEPDELLAAEWSTYIPEVERLISEGHEGKHVLIKDEQT